MGFISIIFYTIFISTLATIISWFWRNRKHNALINKLPGIGRLYLIGNCGYIIKTYASHPDPPVAILERALACEKLFEKHGCVAFKFFSFPLVKISSPEWVSLLLSSNVSLEKSFEYSFLHKWLGLGLLTSSGEKWRFRRKILTPSFHFRILDDFIPTFNEQSMVLVRKLQLLPNKEQVEIFPLIILCTLDIICETVMGSRIGAQAGENPHYVRAIHDVAGFFTKRSVSPWLWTDILLRLTESGRQFEKNLDILHSLTRRVINEKKNSFLKRSYNVNNCEKEDEFQGKKKKSLMDLLLHMHLQGEQLTLNDIQEEVDTFMFEGHDTTATASLFALYSIGLYPDVQEKVYDEIQSIFGDDVDRDVSKEDIRKMKYLECTLKESQRLFPTVPIIGRTLKEDLHNNGLTIPKGTEVHCSIISLHRNPKYFPNPEVFDPDRFLPENSLNRHLFCYVPFSAGPRNCIGQKFALLEEKVIVTNILRHFKIISLDPRDKLPFKIEFNLRTARPIRMKFIPRKRQQMP